MPLKSPPATTVLEQHSSYLGSGAGNPRMRPPKPMRARSRSAGPEPGNADKYDCSRKAHEEEAPKLARNHNLQQDCKVDEAQFCHWRRMRIYELNFGIAVAGSECQMRQFTQEEQGNNNTKEKTTAIAP